MCWPRVAGPGRDARDSVRPRKRHAHGVNFCIHVVVFTGSMRILPALFTAGWFIIMVDWILILIFVFIRLRLACTVPRSLPKDPIANNRGRGNTPNTCVPHEGWDARVRRPTCACAPERPAPTGDPSAPGRGRAFHFDVSRDKRAGANSRRTGLRPRAESETRERRTPHTTGTQLSHTHLTCHRNTGWRLRYEIYLNNSIFIISLQMRVRCINHFVIVHFMRSRFARHRVAPARASRPRGPAP